MTLDELLSKCTSCDTVKITTIEGIDHGGIYKFYSIPSRYKTIEVNDFTPHKGEIHVTLDM